MKLRIAVVGLFLLFFSVCPVPETVAGDAVVIKLGSVANEKNIQYEATKYFADMVKEKTKGEIDIQLFFGGQLGAETDMIDSLQMGGIQMMQSFPSKWAPYVSEIGVLDLPFQFKDFDHVRRTTDGMVGQKLAKIVLDKMQVRVLKWWLHGFRNMYTQKPINTAADMKGVKIRVPGIPVFVKTFELIGAVPVSIPWTELYTALQTGVVNACEADLSGAYASKFYEVTKYVIKTKHIYTGSFLVINDDFYQKLSPEHQKAVGEAAEAAEQWLYDKLTAKVQEDEKALADEGMTIVNPDLASFQEKLTPMVDEFLKTVDAKDMVDEIDKLR